MRDRILAEIRRRAAEYARTEAEFRFRLQIAEAERDEDGIRHYESRMAEHAAARMALENVAQWVSDLQPRQRTVRRAVTLRCSTVSRDWDGGGRCTAPATHKITYTIPGDRTEPITEAVCEECAGHYLRRPALQASAVRFRRIVVPPTGTARKTLRETESS